jgi:hypothetical protein
MLRLASALGLLVVLAGSVPLAAQPPAFDAEVTKGMRQVDDGDYDGAIVTLDSAARRLAKDPARVRDLSQSYVYLGIAYVGKGHDAAAKAKFREALAGAKDLTLSADQFPPKVVNLFEQAREDAARADAGSREGKKGGGGKGLLIGGLVAAAGGGVALAAGGGGGGSSTPAGSSAPGATPSGPPVSNRFEGFLTQGQSSALVALPEAGSAGSWQANLDWCAAGTEVRMFVIDAQTRAGVAETRLTGPNASIAQWTGEARKRYEVELFLQEGGAAECSYVLTVQHPQ